MNILDFKKYAYSTLLFSYNLSAFNFQIKTSYKCTEIDRRVSQSQAHSTNVILLFPFVLL